jgi:hypothetical protein
MNLDYASSQARRKALWLPVAETWLERNPDCLKDGHYVYRPDGDGWVRLSAQEVRTELYPIASRAEAQHLAATGKSLLIPIDAEVVDYIRCQLPLAPQSVLEAARG